ncbi:MAG: hypothetical protein NWQ77_07490 [Schleiferiaceae bacterium]|nr:hypothetical protein [Schleiferiaceae bacterium]
MNKALISLFLVLINCRLYSQNNEAIKSHRFNIEFATNDYSVERSNGNSFYGPMLTEWSKMPVYAGLSHNYELSKRVGSIISLGYGRVSGANPIERFINNGFYSDLGLRLIPFAKSPSFLNNFYVQITGGYAFTKPERRFVDDGSLNGISGYKSAFTLGGSTGYEIGISESSKLRIWCGMKMFTDDAFDGWDHGHFSDSYFQYGMSISVGRKK